ncbi:MAG: hypothetical protein M0Q90_13705 [Bacteroidales bacterium]|nr:hypothetical protein [Bacteroidales bacterium]
MDFTFNTYENLLNALLMRGFSFMSFSEHLKAKFYTEQSPSASNLESLNL